MAFDVYAAFREKIENQILEYLPPEYENAKIQIAPVQKNNGVTLYGLNILKPEEKICPTIYLEKYFHEWSGNLKEMEGVLKEIAGFQMKHDRNLAFDTSQVTDFGKARENITCRLVNREQNEKLLKEIPYTPVEDFAVIYQVEVTMGKESGTIQIRNEFMKEYGITTETLHELALKNTQEKSPFSCKSMTEMMWDVMKRTLVEEEGLDEAAAEIMANRMIEPVTDHAGMQVLTNEQRCHGATALLYPEVLEQMAEMYGGNYYILPSSTNEVILIKQDCGMSIEELKGMVQDVNATQVAPEEVLSSHVYAYDAKEKVFYRADQKPEREEKRSMSFQDKLKEKKAEAKATESAVTKPDKKKREECL